MKKIIITVLACIPLVALAYPSLPDPKVTPGVVSEAVTQENIQKTICVKGYTSTIRPSGRYTNKVKLSQLNNSYKSDLAVTNFKEDHLISLELGGHPTDVKNLWPQLSADSYKKDKLENVLNALVCKGKITLAEAQKAETTNWITSYQKYMVKK